MLFAGGETQQQHRLSQVPLYLGRRFALQGDMSQIFNNNAPGYVLNKAALKSLVRDAIPSLTEDQQHARTSSHHTMVAQAFRNVGIHAYPTQDENGGERFMPFPPRHHLMYRFPKDKDTTVPDWYEKYSLPGVKEGLDHFAARSISFHYVRGDEMAHLYTLAYGLCPDSTGWSER